MSFISDVDVELGLNDEAEEDDDDEEDDDIGPLFIITAAAADAATVDGIIDADVAVGFHSLAKLAFSV